MGVWKVAVPAALMQIGASLVIMLLLSQLFGWPLGLAILLGFVVALSSTAVVVKMLEQINILRGPVGQLTVGVLIAQDLAVVPMILVLQGMGGSGFDATGVLTIIASIAGMVGLTVWLSRRKRLSLPFSRLVAGQFDLRPLSGLAYCFGAAALSGLVGLSPAYGAFLAGLVIGNSNARAVMIRSMRPIQSVLMMVFFLSIGLLLDLAFIGENLATVAMLLLVVTVLKTALNIGILHILREPWPHAFIAGIMLAQIGEFSFVLGQTGREAGLITAEDSALIVSVTAFSLLFSPLWQMTARRLLRIVLLSVTSLGETIDILGGPRAISALQRTAQLAGVAKDGAGALSEEVLAQLKQLARRMRGAAANAPHPAPDIEPRSTRDREPRSTRDREPRSTSDGEPGSTPDSGSPADETGARRQTKNSKPLHPDENAAGDEAAEAEAETAPNLPPHPEPEKKSA
jgi:CPA2 family monovalent cation:H+ antiporter-2